MGLLAEMAKSIGWLFALAAVAFFLLPKLFFMLIGDPVNPEFGPVLHAACLTIGASMGLASINAFVTSYWYRRQIEGGCALVICQKALENQIAAAKANMVLPIELRVAGCEGVTHTFATTIPLRDGLQLVGLVEELYLKNGILAQVIVDQAAGKVRLEFSDRGPKLERPFDVHGVVFNLSCDRLDHNRVVSFDPHDSR